jgi:hypothetical protein
MRKLLFVVFSVLVFGSAAMAQRKVDTSGIARNNRRTINSTWATYRITAI